MKVTTATDAKVRFGQLLEEALVAPVAIEKHGRVVAYLVSARDYGTRPAGPPRGDPRFAIEGAIAPIKGAPAGSRLGKLLSARARQRLRRARELASRTLARLSARGVTARIVGSLAKGRFRADSDVDYLIENRGKLSDAEILSVVEACMKDFPFDVIFRDRADWKLLEMMLKESGDGPSAVRQA